MINIFLITAIFFSLKKISVIEHHLTYWRWIHRKQQFFRSWKLSQFTVRISRSFEDTKASNFPTGFCAAICRSQNTSVYSGTRGMYFFSQAYSRACLLTTMTTYNYPSSSRCKYIHTCYSMGWGCFGGLSLVHLRKYVPISLKYNYY